MARYLRRPVLNVAMEDFSFKDFGKEFHSDAPEYESMDSVRLIRGRGTFNALLEFSYRACERSNRSQRYNGALRRTILYINIPLLSANCFSKGNIPSFFIFSSVDIDGSGKISLADRLYREFTLFR